MGVAVMACVVLSGCCMEEQRRRSQMTHSCLHVPACLALQV